MGRNRMKDHVGLHLDERFVPASSIFCRIKFRRRKMWNRRMKNKMERCWIPLLKDLAASVHQGGSDARPGGNDIICAVWNKWTHEEAKKSKCTLHRGASLYRAARGRGTANRNRSKGSWKSSQIRWVVCNYVTGFCYCETNVPVFASVYTRRKRKLVFLFQLRNCHCCGKV